MERGLEEGRDVLPGFREREGAGAGAELSIQCGWVGVGEIPRRCAVKTAWSADAGRWRRQEKETTEGGTPASVTCDCHGKTCKDANRNRNRRGRGDLNLLFRGCWPRDADANAHKQRLGGGGAALSLVVRGQGRGRMGKGEVGGGGLGCFGLVVRMAERRLGRLGRKAKRGR